MEVLHSPPNVRSSSNSDQLPRSAQEPIAIRLFVGRVPETMDEDAIKELFEEEGNVLECQIIRDKETNAHKFSAFVRMASITDADRAVREIHNKKLPPGHNGAPLQVKYAKGEVERLGFTNESTEAGFDEGTLFAGSLPFDMEDEGLKALFAPHGSLVSATVLKGPNGLSKACGFVKFCYKEQALHAIKGLQGTIVEGSRRALDVRFAVDRQTKLQERYKAAQEATVPAPSGSPPKSASSDPPDVQQQLLTALLSNPTALAALVNPAAAQTIQQLLGAGAPPKEPPPCYWKEYSLPDGNCYYHNWLTNQTTWQRPPELDTPREPQISVLPQQRLPQVPSFNQSPTNQQSNSFLVNEPSRGPAIPPPPHRQSIPEGVPGPPGANVFLFHVPQHWRQEDIFSHFSGFGKIVSITVPLTRSNGESNRGYAFLCYEDVSSAAKAVEQMNGFMIGNKRLKVSVKKGEEDHAAPYMKPMSK
eukprot:GHVN01049648.1.p1 GENE.GHVN01049648.1~~GHVN01049648.1.p1  ORF type:complete len:492 (+),score=39.52 GHVN01049648.1:53-1477(+)